MNYEVLNSLWMLEFGFANRMHNIILPRLAAGLMPIPSEFFAATNAERNKGQGTPYSYQGKSFFDVDGDWDILAQELYWMKKAGNFETAVIPLKGTMSREGFCGEGSNEKLMKLLEKAEADPQVKTIVLDVNTPGGTVDSTQELADMYAAIKKPKVAFVRSMMASGGVLAASASDAIVMNTEKSTSIGSIGVIMYYMNAAKSMEKQGIEPRIIRATKSVDKAKLNDIEPLTDELEAEIVAKLDGYQAMFEGYVKRGRVGRLQSEEVFTGKMYHAKDALRLGLADRVGTLADAISLSKKL